MCLQLFPESFEDAMTLRFNELYDFLYMSMIFVRHFEGYGTKKESLLDLPIKAREFVTIAAVHTSFFACRARN